MLEVLQTVAYVLIGAATAGIAVGLMLAGIGLGFYVITILYNLSSRN